MALTFVSMASSPVGTPLHVTVYSGGVILDSNVSPVTWAGVPASVSVSPDAPGGQGGYSFNGSAVVQFFASAHDGVSAGTISISFTAPPLQFTNP